MPRSIARYRRVTDAYTTHRLIEPDLVEDDEAVIELCAVQGEDGETVYVSLPEGIGLPEQPTTVAASLEDVELDEETRGVILECSPHVRLVRQRVAAGLMMAPSGHIVEAPDQAAAEAWGADQIASLGL